MYKFAYLEIVSEASVVRCFGDVQVQSYHSEGLSVFAKGLGTTLLRAFVVNGFIFAAYELCMDALSPCGLGG